MPAKIRLKISEHFSLERLVQDVLWKLKDKECIYAKLRSRQGDGYIGAAVS